MSTTKTQGLTASTITARSAVVSLALAAILAVPTPGHAVTPTQATSIMSTATGLIGKPYYWGGKDPTKGGIDCSGLTKWCYMKAGITIPDGSANQYAACNMCVSTKTKAALLFFATDPAKPGAMTHVTLSSGDGVYSIGANGSPIFDKSGKLIGNTGSVQKWNFVNQSWAKLLTCAMSSKW